MPIVLFVGPRNVWQCYREEPRALSRRVHVWLARCPTAAWAEPTKNEQWHVKGPGHRAGANWGADRC